uniref:Uncharacterized protein n=1 Tax=Arundo donax TaxID=35708 RepID=A0A0A9CP45_ARUDO
MQWQHQGGSLNQILESTGVSGICPQCSNPVSLTRRGVQGLSQPLQIADCPHPLPQAHPMPIGPHHRSTLALPHPGPHLAQPLLLLTGRHCTLLPPWPVQSQLPQREGKQISLVLHLCGLQPLQHPIPHPRIQLGQQGHHPLCRRVSSPQSLVPRSWHRLL